MKKFTLFFLLFSSLSLLAQINHGGEPYAFSHKIDLATTATTELQTPNIEQLEQTDATTKQFKRARFAVSVDVNIDPNHDGSWTKVNSGWIWQHAIKSSSAKGLSVTFRQFNLTSGSKLFIYNPESKQFIGSFTAENNRESGIFATQFITGNELIIELFSPTKMKNPFTISEIGYAYKSISYSEKGFGTSGNCEVNVNCPEGNDFQTEKRGIAKILAKAGGSYYLCSGTLINNTAEDDSPLFLTAFHCGAGASDDEVAQWIFDFNYESETCANPAQEPSQNSVTGAVLLAKSMDINSYDVGCDFFLVKITSPLESSWDLVFNGWDRATDITSSGVSIHHPDGDIKKISTYTVQPTLSYWDNNAPQNLTHWEVNWAETETNWGVTEGGSSGAPLFNSNGKVVGQLTGGGASCSNQSLADYYGRFSWAWENESTEAERQLAPWLDPLNTNQMTINSKQLTTVERIEKSALSLFPCPATTALSFTTDNSFFGDLTITFRTVSGKEVISETCRVEKNQTHTVNVSSLMRGVYIVTLTNREKTVTSKAIIQ